MASAAYNAWTAVVKKAGGRVVIPPTTGRTIPSVPSAAYPDTVWVPKVNGKQWPIPNEFSVNGKTGYYHAPAELQEEISKFGQATQQEIKAGADKLMDQWGVPTMFRGLGNYIGSLGMIALVLFGVYVVATKRK